MPPSQLVVVVPARNEEARIPHCLGSLAAQTGVELRVLLSDNASTDATAATVAGASGGLDLTVRTVGPLGPSEHFVSSIRWALQTTDGEAFVLLAGDDTWSAGFARAAMSLLEARPDVDVVFPTFVWEGGGPERRLRPKAFLNGSPTVRRLAALVLPDRRELSNLVYGVFRRSAFVELADAWAAGGDEFGADFAAAYAVIGAHRVAACPGAVGRRFVRADADLLERIGFRRGDASGPVAMVSTYVRLNLAINSAIAAALRRVSDRAGRPRTAAVQLLRSPQWLWGAVGQVRSAASGSSGQPG